ncbi:hypothetical protein Peur_015029 [Populus x canadensis]
MVDLFLRAWRSVATAVVVLAGGWPVAGCGRRGRHCWRRALLAPTGEEESQARWERGEEDGGWFVMAAGSGGPSLAKKGGSGFGSLSAQKMERPQGMGATTWCWEKEKSGEQGAAAWCWEKEKSKRKGESTVALLAKEKGPTEGL